MHFTAAVNAKPQVKPNKRNEIKRYEKYLGQ